ncbi:hypothetical protein WCE55_02485 [Luteimonas sp. MJ293]|uniref:hypothetical protein n=1 Tax=Luteimonas sp. MJ146 TaxID=3129240 RepID=UPI0031BAF259
MTRQQAIEAIRASVSRGTASPIFEADRDNAVKGLARELESAAIDPVPAAIGGITYPDEDLAKVLAADAPLVIARAGDNWLGFLPSRQEFFLAHGPSAAQLNALGFYSSDALAEWRG